MRAGGPVLSMLRRLSGGRWIAVLGLDGIITATSFSAAMLLRYEGSIPEPDRTLLPAFAFLFVGFRILSNLLLLLHRWSFRLSGLTDGARVGMAAVFGTGLFLASMYLMRHPGPPRSVVVLELLLSTLLMGTLRFSPRLAGMYMTDWARNKKDGVLRTFIVGAGSAGELLLRDLQRSQDHGYQIVGFIDDNVSKRDMIVGGRTVLGEISELPNLARAHRVDQVLIAVPRLEARRIREILSLCADLKLRFKIMPASYAYLQERGASSVMQDLSPEDLLPREPVTFAENEDSPCMEQRVALVTGAAGSIGSEICAQLLKAGLRSLVMVDLDENGLYLLKHRLERQHPPLANINIEIADIRDVNRIRDLFTRYGPQDVFHAAAHKHVPLMETAPCEAVKNNILGTRNVAEAAHAARADRFIFISTDKAVRPTSVMGASKRVAEELVRTMARGSGTDFCAVRFGNVLASAGSVVPLFLEQIADGGPVTVTHPEVRRYFMTISEAVALVLKAAYGNFGALCVLDMGEQIRIVDLARHLITMSGQVPDQDVPIEFIGLRPGEKLAEELLTEEEERTRRVNEKIFVADCPPPAETLGDRIHLLAQAAADEDSDRVLELLQQIVPSYKPARETAVLAS